MASLSAPPFLADSSSHGDLKCFADLLVREKVVKDHNGALKFVPFYISFFIPLVPSSSASSFPVRENVVVRAHRHCSQSVCLTFGMEKGIFYHSEGFLFVCLFFP